MIPPLKPNKSKVRALDVPGTSELEVCRVGEAGFQCKGLGRTYWWADRGRTWSSDELDRIDSAKAQFKDAAFGGEQKGTTGT